MAFTYSGITNYGKATLPSVEGWGNNMNILRDPPKSITTRRKNRVGQTSSVTEMIDQSENRNSEAIQVYARGVNPSVSVSYDNNGNNGGGSGGLTGLGQSISGLGAGSAPKLRHTIMKDQVFRPPVRTQQDLLPLSRLPRLLTSANTLPGFADYSKKAWTATTAEKTREVKTSTIKTCVRPTARYIVQTPLTKPSNTVTHIQNPLTVSANSGVRTRDLTEQYMGKINNQIYEQPFHAFATANPIQPGKQVNTSDKYVDNNIQDTSGASATTNFSTQKFYSNIEDILDIQMPVQEIRTTDITAPTSGYEKNDYIHDEINLKRNVPDHEITVNISDRSKYLNPHEGSVVPNLVMKRPNVSISVPVKVDRRDQDTTKREAYLPPRSNRGGFHNQSSKPMVGRMQNVRESFTTRKSKMSKSVSESMQGRFNNSSKYK